MHRFNAAGPDGLFDNWTDGPTPRLSPHGFSIWKFIKYIKEELLIALGTSSSESVLSRPFRSSVTIPALVAKALKRAGVKVHRPGAHILRHTLATQMVRQGAAFKEIADILGHLSLASTSVYAKLDLESLSKVAMPWPGGAQ